MNSGRFRNYLKQDKIKMRFFILLLFAICVSAKINPKALTESMGQEVIEIGAPIKDLEEEPSAENEDDKTTTTIQVATTKETRRVKTYGRRNTETNDLEDEKEIGIYGDRHDNKTVGDGDGTVDNTTLNITQDVARAGTRKKKSKTKQIFKFQPNPNDPEDIARFRTSQDYWHCDMLKLTGTMATQPDGRIEEKNSCGISKEFIPLLLLCIIIYI
ncbi:uncharacterized protein LOC116778487 isoform X3 [Danaus plexippus]|uniref:uncharacterized protein LOC116778487 isoform X3 n=1 Tax=Danaus plexippus TaxID=13037 RepID=UPI002AAFC92A|nr:uncharacterized protein LOC116778487 isoform X3 [Danaus plexippus]